MLGVQLSLRTVGALSLAVLACAPQEPSGLARATTPIELPTPAAGCSSPLSEYCASAGGPCPTVVDTSQRRKLLCTSSGAWRVEERHCVGRFVAISWRQSLLGGGDEYFDGEGKLFAAFLVTDYGAYCNRSAFSQTFGEVPVCSSQLIITDLCK